FQAEDGIRDDLVTGVQTCALPISVAVSGVAVRAGVEVAGVPVLDGLPQSWANVSIRPGERLPVSQEYCVKMVSLPQGCTPIVAPDRKSTRLNSSHQIISYAVFCLR